MNSSPQQLDLAVAITTCNNMRTIDRALASVEPLAARIVVVDSGSTDGTIERCRQLGAEVMHRDWDGPVRQKQFAIDLCREHKWVLLLDSDESLEPPLQESMRRALEHDDPGIAGWEINRKIWFLGGWLNHTFQPEWRLRLVRGGRGRIAGIGAGELGGHDRIEVDGRTGRLDGDCRHDSWESLRHMMDRYVELAERSGRHYERGGSLVNIFVSPGAALLKQLLIKQGVRDGWRGIIAAGGAAAGTLMKHLFIAQRKMNRSSAVDNWKKDAPRRATENHGGRKE